MPMMTPEASKAYVSLLRSARNILEATPAAVDEALEPMEAMLKEMVPPEQHDKLEERFLSKLDLRNLADRWVLTMYVLDRVWPDIAFELYAVGLMHKSEVLDQIQHDGTMVSIFGAIHGDLATDTVHDPKDVLANILEQIDQERDGMPADVIEAARDEFVQALVSYTQKRIDAALALHTLYASRGATVEMLSDLANPEMLERLGAPELLVEMVKQRQAETRPKPDADTHPDELEARERIHAAALQSHKDDPRKAIEWATHPERLFIVKGDERIALVSGVMSDPLSTEQIMQLIARDFVVYDKNTPVHLM